MTKHDNNDLFPQSELELLESAMQNMMHGTMGSLFRQLIGPSVLDMPHGAEEQPDATASHGDDFGGNDFKRLAKKSKAARGLISEDVEQQQAEQQRSSPIFESRQAMIPDRFPRDIEQRDAFEPLHNIFQMMFSQPLLNETYPFPSNEGSDTGTSTPSSSFWSYSSSSQRSVLKADGTKETIYTTTQNGVTETVKSITYPDGTVEEIRERQDGGNHRQPFVKSLPSPQDQGAPILQRMWKSIFG
ncbi:hypothetical protein EC973_002125 [Apophysomyces ossiformis]|uniref:Uncharacterized protein n=1 Tax=Apophysomyces ossiformis TaxID=679940 RepID=A0A8H7BIS0_9FUNG|nr:hypothetical protein EC973_002125 [Apophysomyces ossiformis]